MEAEGSMKDQYRAPLIAMSFFAVLFFIILVVILIVWCKKRRQTEVKTIEIQPKKRPISTKQTNGGSQHVNGNTDIEAGAITADEIELSDEHDSPSKGETESSPSATESSPSAHGGVNAGETTSEPQAASEEPAEKITDMTELVADSTRSADADEDKGEVNPSFQQDEEEESPVS